MITIIICFINKKQAKRMRKESLMAKIAISEKKQNRTMAWTNTGMPCAYRRHKGGER